MRRTPESWTLSLIHILIRSCWIWFIQLLILFYIIYTYLFPNEIVNQFFDLKDRKDIPISYSNHVTMRNICLLYTSPRLVHISHSNNVQLSGVRLINSPFWTTHLYNCLLYTSWRRTGLFKPAQQNGIHFIHRRKKLEQSTLYRHWYQSRCV